MAAKYNFSIERKGIKGRETFQVIGCDSFDEAIRIVEKGVHDREIFEATLIPTVVNKPFADDSSLKISDVVPMTSNVPGNDISTPDDIPE